MNESSLNYEEKMMDEEDEFQKAFINIFPNNYMIPESDEKSNVNKSLNIIQNSIFNNIIGNTEEINVEIKNRINLFKTFKDDDFILFNPKRDLDYYDKYTNLIFKVWKEKPARREKVDEIMKKIKARFFKDVKKHINDIFKIQGIPKKLKDLPQSFITDITKKSNKLMLEKTLEEIIIGYKEKKDNPEKKNSIEKKKNNIELLNYLKSKDNADNKIIQKIYYAFNTKIKELFKEYLKSKQFEESIIKLREDGNYLDYIKEYIDKAKDFINYFSK